MSGKEKWMNTQILRYLSLEGPAIPYQVRKAIEERSQNKIHYPTVNRRISDLVENGYLVDCGTKATKSGIKATLYETTSRGDLSALAIGLDPFELRRLIEKASKKENTPFSVIQYMLDNGYAYEKAREELLAYLINGVKIGIVNFSAQDEVIIAISLLLILLKLRELSLDNVRDYQSNALKCLQTAITNSMKKDGVSSSRNIGGLLKSSARSRASLATRCMLDLYKLLSEKSM